MSKNKKSDTRKKIPTGNFYRCRLVFELLPRSRICSSRIAKRVLIQVFQISDDILRQIVQKLNLFFL